MKIDKIVAVISISLILYSQLNCADEKTLVIATNEYPPFTSEQMKNKGYISEMLTLIFANMSVNINIQFFPWSRAVGFAKNGDVDGLIGWYKDERTQWLEYSDPLVPSKIVFFKHKTTQFFFDNFTALPSFRIGTIRGYSMPAGFEKEKLNLYLVNSELQALHMLSSKRIDLAIIDKDVGRYLICVKAPHLKDFIDWVEPPITINDNYLMISKKNNQYHTIIKQFNEQLRQLKEKGEMEKMLKKHDLEYCKT